MLKSGAITLLVVAADVGLVAAKRAHPGIALDPKFRAQLRCPYADRWLAKGPEQAARELGLDSQGRRLEESVKMEVKGSCSYSNPWSGATCLQFDGSGWTVEDMAARCDKESGTWSVDGCTEAAGWCTKTIAGDKVEATAMVLSAMADCDGSKMACQSFMGGTFVAAGECLTGSESEGGNMFGGSSGGPPPGVATGGMGGPPPGVMAGGAAGSGEGPKCLIAPGAIGAAHQAGFSKGYSNSCPGTPAQESPYMWPMKWAADYENQAMAFGSDVVVYTSRGRTFYMLDKNWKRSDTVHQEGVLRAIVTGGPCDNIDTDGDGIVGCYKNQTDGTMWTMLHLENMMYFIDWKPDAEVSPGELDASKVANCTELDMAVVGNIRPDWFLDKRGDDTDVQYLGDQHVYYDGAATVPKLVKQWRKKDFASQYFVMSMMGNPPNKLAQDENAPVEDNIHWPLILNVPGEGFGDDSLQVYRNHELLSDEHEELFKLIDNFKAMGGVCVSGRGGGPAEGEGTDDHERPHIPSNLEVDPQSWMTNEITFSPIWEVPTQDVSDGSEPPSEGGKTVLEVSDRITVESCYDESTKSMDMSVHFKGVEPAADGLLPWMAIGYRESEVCAMTPRTGGSTPIVLVTQSAEDAAPEAHKTELLPSAKSGQQSVFASMYSGMTPLGDEKDFMNVLVESADDDDIVALNFKQEVGEMPESMHMTFAIGMTSELGYHTTRGCFQVEATPCAPAKAEVSAEQEGVTVDLSGKGESEVSTASSPASSDKSVLEVSDRLTVESCYNESNESMHMSVHFHDIEATSNGLLPWMAIGYLPSDKCHMTPPKGGVTPIVLMTQETAGNAPEAHKTMLLPNTKSMDKNIFSSMMSLAMPLEGEEEYHHVSVEAPMVSAPTQVARSSSSLLEDDTVSLHFMQTVGEQPEVINLMYAIGLTSELGVHVARDCFQVKPTPCSMTEVQESEASVQNSEAGMNAHDSKSESQGSMGSTEITIDLGENEKMMDAEAVAAKSPASKVSYAGTMLTLLAFIAGACRL